MELGVGDPEERAVCRSEGAGGGLGSNYFLQVGRCMPIYACMGEYKDFVVNPERDREPV